MAHFLDEDHHPSSSEAEGRGRRPWILGGLDDGDIPEVEVHQYYYCATQERKDDGGKERH
jgi:hypothetical protein